MNICDIVLRMEGIQVGMAFSQKTKTWWFSLKDNRKGVDTGEFNLMHARDYIRSEWLGLNKNSQIEVDKDIITISIDEIDALPLNKNGLYHD